MTTNVECRHCHKPIVRGQYLGWAHVTNPTWRHHYAEPLTLGQLRRMAHKAENDTLGGADVAALVVAAVAVLAVAWAALVLVA